MDLEAVLVLVRKVILATVWKAVAGKIAVHTHVVIGRTEEASGRAVELLDLMT